MSWPGVLAMTVRLISPPATWPDGRPLSEAERASWHPTAANVTAAARAFREATTAQRLALGLPSTITRTQAETDADVAAALAHQERITGLLRNYATDDPGDCATCQELRAVLHELGVFDPEPDDA